MSDPQGSYNVVSCPSHTKIQDRALSGIMISHLNNDFKFIDSLENELKDCIVTSLGIEDDTRYFFRMWNLKMGAINIIRRVVAALTGARAMISCIGAFNVYMYG